MPVPGILCWKTKNIFSASSDSLVLSDDTKKCRGYGQSYLQVIR